MTPPLFSIAIHFVKKFLISSRNGWSNLVLIEHFNKLYRSNETITLLQMELAKAQKELELLRVQQLIPNELKRSNLEKEPFLQTQIETALQSLSGFEEVVKALRDSEARYQSIIDSDLIGFMSWNAEGEINEANNALLKMMGYSREELNSGKMNWASMTPPEYVEQDRRVMQELQQNCKSAPFEKEYVRKDGSRLPVLIGAVNFEGYMDRGVAFVIDLSTKKRAEEALRFQVESSKVLASTLDYETILQSVVRLVVPTLADLCIIDLLNKDGELRRVAFAHANEEKEKIFVAAHQHYIPDLQSSHPVARALRTGSTIIIPELDDEILENISKNEEHFKFMRRLDYRSYIAVPLKARGHKLGVIALILTEGNRSFTQENFELSEELAQRAALAVDNALLYKEVQQALNARNDFLAVAAHELKTPITSMRGYSQLILEKLKKNGFNDLTRLIRSMEVIEQQTGKLTHLVTQLLDITNIEAGRLVLEFRDTDITNLVSNVIEQAQSTTVRHNISLKADHQHFAKVDSLRFEQIITNLVDNAVKYSPEGGPILVEIKNDQPSILQISVCDRGVGVAPDQQKKIFERFYQAHGRHYYRGLGLGLFISRQLIELHGGQIYYEEPKDGGSRFVINIPAGLDLDTSNS